MFFQEEVICKLENYFNGIGGTVTGQQRDFCIEKTFLGEVEVTVFQVPNDYTF